MICVAHLLHNYAITVNSYFDDLDQLIAKVTSATVKNKTRQAKFATIGCSPRPVVTRCGSWLNAASYYATNLTEAKAIVESFEGSGILVTQAKVSLQTTSLATQILKIKNRYECLVKLIEMMKNTKYTIIEAVQANQELDFRKDACSISRFI